MGSRQQIGFFGVLTLVLLRVAVGWHFFDQGIDKFKPGFSSEGFLRAAKGPLAENFQSMAHGVHGVDTLLFVSKEWGEGTPEQIASAVGWQRFYEKRLKEAANKNKPKPITENWELPEGPASDWFGQISADWQQYSEEAAKLGGGDSKEACRKAFLSWQGKLGVYLTSQSEAMAEYQNELWRLDQLEADAPAGTLPYNDERWAKKYGETFSTSRKWVADVRSFDTMYRNELIEIATDAGANRGAVAGAVDPPTQLDRINEVVKWTVVGVGVCLMLGFCTRFTAVIGALFLCSVIATQPLWIAGATPIWNQLVEACGMLVLAVFGAGQWLGVDAFIKGLRKVN